MLLNQNQTEASTPNTRITPQELAQAITAVEAQKEAEAQKKAETASLIDTIHHFGLDATPEELLTAVNAQRKEAAKQQKMQQYQKEVNSFTRVILAGIVIGVAFVFYSVTHTRQSRYIQRLQSVASNTSASTLTPLALASEGQPVYVTFSDIVALANGKSAQQILTAPTVTSTASGTRQWTILKFRNHYFVRGWRYRTDGDNKEYADWLASIPRDVSAEETGETPIERFKSINQPPSIADDSAQQGEQIDLPSSEK